MREVICEACGGTFQPQHDTRYCCGACRQDAYRRRKELEAKLAANPRFRLLPNTGKGIVIGGGAKP